MEETTVHQFRAQLKTKVDQCIQNREPLRVKRRNGEDFVVVGAKDWRAIEETLFLNQIPGMVKSIHRAAKEPLSKGKPLKDFNW